jgi:hypothetical protein
MQVGGAAGVYGGERAAAADALVGPRQQDGGAAEGVREWWLTCSAASGPLGRLRAVSGGLDRVE